MAKELYEIGEIPPLGEVPPKMYAQVVRSDRLGEPKEAFRIEVMDTPQVGPGQVLVLTMAAGVNYNQVWAARGVPVDISKQHARYGEPDDFHLGGSDGSGVVWSVGEGVANVKVGDHVTLHSAQWDRDDPWVESGGEPGIAPTFRVWGYESNWGSYGQFCLVQAHQCMPKAPGLSWEEAATPTLVGATAYRMLFGWPPHTVEPGDVVLVWGGAGGLGSMAIQLAAQAGGRPVAVVSSEEKAEFCRRLGAVGTINRKEFEHWGLLPHWTDAEAFGAWMKGARAFGAALWDAVGERKSPKIVFEHPGEDTIPTSIFVADTGGMVVICAGTTGYNAVVDLRYLWMRQKRFQGSHLFNDHQARAFNELVREGKIDPCLSRTFSFDELPLAHQLMHENRHPEGNMAVLVNAREPGTRDLPA